MEEKALWSPERKQRVIRLFAARRGLDMQDALWFFYASSLCADPETEKAAAGLSDEALAELLEAEYTGSVPYHC